MVKFHCIPTTDGPFAEDLGAINDYTLDPRAVVDKS